MFRVSEGLNTWGFHAILVVTRIFFVMNKVKLTPDVVSKFGKRSDLLIHTDFTKKFNSTTALKEKFTSLLTGSNGSIATLTH